MQTSSTANRRMSRADIIRRLRALNVCDAGLEWIDQTPGEPADLWAECRRGDWMLWLLEMLNYDERTLRHLACDCVEDALGIYERECPADSRLRRAIAVERRYADGEATDDELRAARIASWAAASEAARIASWIEPSEIAQASSWAAARAAAWGAPLAAAIAAAAEAARAAAWDTAGEAASRAAWAAALAAASEMARTESWGAAGDAAGDVARVKSLAAAWDADNTAAYAAARARQADIIRARISWADVERAIAAVGAQEAC